MVSGCALVMRFPPLEVLRCVNDISQLSICQAIRATGKCFPSADHANIRSMIVCLQLPRFALTVAAGRGAQLTAPLALAPEAGREPVVGEVSAAAEAHGVRAGMRLGGALARCPALRLVPPDPAGGGGAPGPVPRGPRGGRGGGGGRRPRPG